MTLSGLLTALQLIQLAAPLVKSAVDLAETTFGAGNGTRKLAHAVATVESALPQVARLAQNADAVRAAVKPLIEATVAAANAAEKPAPRARRRKK